MRKRCIFSTLAIVAALATAPSSAGEPEPTADVQVRVPVPPPAAGSILLRRTQIFHVLRGGLAVHDASLAAHLWRVADSLAERGWTPPRVTVRTVVDETDQP